MSLAVVRYFRISEDLWEMAEISGDTFMFPSRELTLNVLTIVVETPFVPLGNVFPS